MSKIRKHSNVKGKGSRNRATVTTFTGKKNPLLRKIGDGYGSWITDNWKNIIAYTIIWAVFLYSLRFIIQ